jgi:hypothetical protein
MAKIQLDINTLQLEHSELTSCLSSPTAYADPDYTTKNRRLTELDNLITKAKLRQLLEGQLVEAEELANSDDELADIAQAEVAESYSRSTTNCL